MPLTTAGPINPDDPLSNTLSANAAPTTVPVKMPTKVGRALELASGGMYDASGGEDTTKPPMNGQPTKYGALLKLLQPAMHGALIGGFLGKSTPGGGFAAANNYYLQQRMRQMQMAQFMQQMMLNQSNITKNQAEAMHAARQGAVSRTGPSITVRDTDPNSPTFGKSIVKTQNVETGEYEPAGEAPPKTPNFKEVPTDQGIVTYDPANPKAGAIPLTLAEKADAVLGDGTGQSASEPSQRAQGKIPTRFDSGSPRVPGTGAVSASPSASPSTISATRGGGAQGVPLRPPTRATAPNAENETFNYLTKPIAQGGKGLSAGKAWAQINAARRGPDRAGSRADQKADDTARVEKYAGAALDSNGNDPDKAIQSLNSLKIADPNAAKDFNRLLPQIRKSITDRAKSRKPKGSLADQLLHMVQQPDQTQPNQ
jgi:hypothetical protein